MLAGCSPGSSTGSGEIITLFDAAIDPPPEPEETCDIHPTEESSDDGCCGCHYFSLPGECLADCQPQPDPCIDETGTAIVGCEPILVVFDGTTTYYRIGSGVSPNEGEYEYEMGQSGNDGKIKRNGGDNKRGVSFFDTEAAAKAARDRIPGSTAKIHKVSSFPQTDLTFVEKKPPNNHYHLVPNRNNMTLNEYREALKKVRLTKVEP